MYAVMNLGAFAVVTLVARSGDRRTSFEDYNGIGFRAPARAHPYDNGLARGVVRLAGAPCPGTLDSSTGKHHYRDRCHPCQAYPGGQKGEEEVQERYERNHEPCQG